jgi:hypothetical protein
MTGTIWEPSNYVLVEYDIVNILGGAVADWYNSSLRVVFLFVDQRRNFNGSGTERRNKKVKPLVYPEVHK